MNKLSFIGDSGKKWEVYPLYFPVFFKNNKCDTKLECLELLEIMTVSLLQDVRKEIKKLKEGEKEFHYWYTEAQREGDKWYIVIKEVVFVKCKKIYQCWDKYFKCYTIHKHLPNDSWSIDGTIYSLYSLYKPEKDKLIEELNLLTI